MIRPNRSLKIYTYYIINKTKSQKYFYTDRTTFTKKLSAIIEPIIRPAINVINDHRIDFL